MKNLFYLILLAGLTFATATSCKKEKDSSDDFFKMKIDNAKEMKCKGVVAELIQSQQFISIGGTFSDKSYIMLGLDTDYEEGETYHNFSIEYYEEDNTPIFDIYNITYRTLSLTKYDKDNHVVEGNFLLNYTDDQSIEHDVTGSFSVSY